uniref:Uncharacterized protein n=1 Tax=Magallana gigas TaxID=29159 RepID=K1R032_MAGGI
MMRFNFVLFLVCAIVALCHAGGYGKRPMHYRGYGKKAMMGGSYSYISRHCFNGDIFQMECGTRHPTMIKDTITEECPQDIHMDITRECPVSDMPVLDTLLLLDPAGPV